MIVIYKIAIGLLLFVAGKISWVENKRFGVSTPTNGWEEDLVATRLNYYYYFKKLLLDM